MPILNLSRVVRMTIPAAADRLRDGANTYAGTPLTSSMGAYYEFAVSYDGIEAPETGFVFSIYDIDRGVRDTLPAILAHGLAAGTDPIELIPRLRSSVADAIGHQPSTFRWTLNPYHHLTMHTNDTNSVTLSRHYTFSASHRLSLPGLSDEENYVRFGKCSRPNGHGHNYELVVHARIPLDQDDFDSIDLDSIIIHSVIDHLDHRNLNLDIDAFKSANPTLERITVHCHELIESALAGTPAGIERIEVWENDRTSCSYPPAPTAAGSPS